MIVKNEKDNLPRCLDSVRNIVDEMIVVDTGSTDDTVKIAKSYGAKVYHFSWNGNFSDARNFSLKFASGDWILLMDADDELEPADQQKLVELTEKEEVEAYFFETISYIGEVPGLDIMKNLNMRLIRNGRGYFFSNPIHEQIYSNIKAINPTAKILTENIRIYHFGYLNKNITGQDKRRRNIGILEKELQQHPDYSFALFNLGNEYFALGDNAKALEYYEKSYTNFDPDQGFSSKLLLKMVNCVMNLGKYDYANQLIDEGLKFYPDFTDLVYMRGLIYSGLGKYIPAIKAFTQCIEMGEASSYFNMIIGAGTYRSCYALGEVYYNMDAYDEAKAQFEAALQENPEFSPALIKLIKTLSAKKLGMKAVSDCIDKYKKGAPEHFDSMIYDTLIQEKYFDLAIKYIEKTEKRRGVSSSTAYYKGLCKLFLKKYKSACTGMETLKKDPEYAARAVCAQALCRILEGKYDAASALLSNSPNCQNDLVFIIYSTFLHVLKTGNVPVLSDNETESAKCTAVILDLLKILLILHEFELFEKTLSLLNTINDKTVLLQLGKLYYSQECHGLAYQELIRSIKLFDYIDIEGINMLQKLKYKGL